MQRRIITHYRHTQAIPSSTWIITHSLKDYPIVDVYINNGGIVEKILPVNVVYVDPNIVTINFTTPQIGFASVV